MWKKIQQWATSQYFSQKKHIALASLLVMMKYIHTADMFACCSLSMFCAADSQTHNWKSPNCFCQWLTLQKYFSQTLFPAEYFWLLKFHCITKVSVEFFVQELSLILQKLGYIKYSMQSIYICKLNHFRCGSLFKTSSF